MLPHMCRLGVSQGPTVTVPVTSRYKVSSSLAVRDALLARFGLSPIPELYVCNHLAEGSLLPTLTEWENDEPTIYADDAMCVRDRL